MKASRFLMSVGQKDSDDVFKTLVHSDFIHQCSAGIFHYLPFGTRMITNIENIIREEMDKTGALETRMAILQPQSLWDRGDRSSGYGDETMRVKGIDGKQYILAPTAEEAAVSIIEQFCVSYKQLPCNIYQIGTKYRDDLRPRFGMYRCKEFIMKDAYSFDVDEASAISTFMDMYNAYIRIFKRMGLHPIPVKADTGLIGGNLSYEIVVLAEFGENDVYYNQTDYGVLNSIDDLAKCAASFDETSRNVNKSKCIEIGHIYYLGTKYSTVMDSKFRTSQNQQSYYEMGCYGIGVSRLVTAIKALKKPLPISVSPFQIYLIGTNDDMDLYNKLSSKYTVFFDDRDKSIGYKLKDCDLIGIPICVIIENNGQIKLKYKENTWLITNQEECDMELLYNDINKIILAETSI